MAGETAVISRKDDSLRPEPLSQPKPAVVGELARCAAYCGESALVTPNARIADA
jgi:hypothetical protein